jgi:hypothetical protein
MEAIQKRFATFQQTSMPVVDYYRAIGKVRSIASDQTVEQVLKASQRALDDALSLSKLAFNNVIYILGGPGR